MISAFGVTHSIEKSLKPNHIAALKNAASDYSLGNWRKQSYAHSRLELNRISEAGPLAQRMTISRGMYKKPLGRLTRTKRKVRDQNRKPIFGNPEVAKSYVPGVGYKAAAKLDHVERHIVRNATLGNAAARKKGIVRPQSGRTEINPGIKTPRGKLKQVFPQYSKAETGSPNNMEGFSLINGRGGGMAFVHRDAHDPAATYRHEMAHIGPRRNPVHFQERVKDETRKGREEGRADFIAHGKPTTGQYPGGEQFQRGYNEVQGKMAAAKWRKQNRKS